ncbi:MAG: DPP IV N-terminal domain-containing protein, partial [Fimbriimonadaceae bacterium]
LMGLALLCVSTSAFTQSKHVNQANWKLAERFTPEALRPFLYSSTITPGWINKTDRFWYSWRNGSGQKFWLVDPRSKSKLPLFDSNKMAALLSEVGLKPVDAATLNITTINFDEKDENILRFTVDSVRYEYDRKAETLKKSTTPAPAATPPTGGPGQGGGGGQGGFGGAANRDFKNISPDKKAYVYALDYNLYYVDVVDGKDQTPIQLTKDGEKDYSFGSRTEQDEQRQQFQVQGTGTETPTTERRVRANATWSKDSKRFYITRGDSRKVKELFLVNSLSEPRPTLMTYKYAMPGEVNVTQTELFAFDPDKKELMKLPVEKYKDQRLMDLHWQDKTSDKLRFIRRDRLQRNLEVCEMNLPDKKIDILLTEKVENAFLESQGVRYVKPGEDFIWFSERTGWGHFYLYGNDGKLKSMA